jgi:hypothetical protein
MAEEEEVIRFRAWSHFKDENNKGHVTAHEVAPRFWPSR